MGRFPAERSALARTAERFIKYNPTHEAAPKLAELLKQIDQSHDWTQKDAWSCSTR